MQVSQHGEIISLIWHEFCQPDDGVFVHVELSQVAQIVMIFSAENLQVSTLLKSQTLHLRAPEARKNAPWTRTPSTISSPLENTLKKAHRLLTVGNGSLLSLSLFLAERCTRGPPTSCIPGLPTSSWMGRTKASNRLVGLATCTER